MKPKVNKEGSDKSSTHKPLRLIPGIIIVTLMCLVRYLLPVLAPKAMIIAIFGGLSGGLAVAVWWGFFSRAKRAERWGAIILIIISLYGTSFLLDTSIATANMGLMFIMYSVPVLSLAFVVWAVLTRHYSIVARRGTMIITVVIGSGFWLLLRTNGMTGDGRHDITWRWAETQEEKLLEGSFKVSPISSVPGVEAYPSADWPGFRGRSRDGVVRNTRISTNWSATPPVELWRRPVGPGCSSFAARGNLLYTQEQRGENEVVSSYNLSTGEPVWQHSDKARFYDSHAGPGPRATPVIEGNSVYTLGATGILNAVDAWNGTLKWSRDASSDTGVDTLAWGFAGSPLVVNDVVVVAVSGKLAAYDTLNGNPRWYGPFGGSSYSSPHLVNIDGINQIILMSDSGAVSVDPERGRKLWDYMWQINGRILQPAHIENGDLLFSAENKSVRRIEVAMNNDEWTIRDKWTTGGMMVNFNDFVIHKGFAYGFDGPYLTCLDLSSGKKLWRGGRYRGFILLLADQDLMLILTEKGELALVEADPTKFNQLALFNAIQGKTWNHPVLAGNILVVRNANEMAAFHLPVTE